MNVTFKYLYVPTAMDSIEIEDLGNVYLRASNDDADEWYMSVKTSLGWVEIKQFGPLKIDEEGFNFFFNFLYQKFEYSEKRLYKIIDEFINNSKKAITIAEVISKEDFDGKLAEVADGIR